MFEDGWAFDVLRGYGEYDLDDESRALDEMERDDEDAEYEIEDEYLDDEE